MGVSQAFARLNVFARRLIFQSPRAICSALKMQSSLDGIPHRAERSQSAQKKSVACPLRYFRPEETFKLFGIAADRLKAEFGQALDNVRTFHCR